MRTFILRRAYVAAVAAAFVAAAPGLVAAHGLSTAGSPGDPARPARTAEVVMSEDSNGMHFSPDRFEVQRGEQVKFVIRNIGSVSHEFFLGTKDQNKSHAAMMAAMPDMKHDDPNAKTVEPGQSATLLWRFTHKGEFEFACLVPGHYELGMHGVVAVR
jgi:uncharacterized cupredoxin-like copper-binding protein